jgi:N6-adenosine-specific RNA methylase IME4
MKIGDYATHPAADVFPLLEGARFKALTEDIAAHGLNNPIVTCVNGDGEVLILDGRNRLRACLEANVPPDFVEYNGDNPWAFVRSENAKGRVDLDKGQRVSCVLELLIGEGQWYETKGRPPKSVPEEHLLRKRLVAEAGCSGSMARKAACVQRERPDLHLEVLRGEKTLSQAYTVLGRESAVEGIRNEAAFPAGPFRVLSADPPWAYEKRKDDGTHRARLGYPDMTVEEICAFRDKDGRPVRDLGMEDSILWLWTTNAFMRGAFEVIDAWGYEEKTILSWGKHKMGTGDWLRGKTEHCILAVRGRPVVTLTNQTTWLEGKVREHSRKPTEFYELVEALCPGSKVELFARERREGWATWGAEEDKFDG